jgi:hypothetical protein
MEAFMSARTIVVAFVTSALLSGVVQAARADTWIFRDISRPHGRERSMAAKLADAHRCGATGHQFTDDRAPNMQQCMLDHGWALDHIVPDPAPRFSRNAIRDREDEELEKRNQEAADDAERQRDEEARSDDFQRQIQDQINTDAQMNALANGQ